MTWLPPRGLTCDFLAGWGKLLRVEPLVCICEVSQQDCECRVRGNEALEGLTGVVGEAWICEHTHSSEIYKLVNIVVLQHTAVPAAAAA
jgi:hypothetical protein